MGRVLWVILLLGGLVTTVMAIEDICHNQVDGSRLAQPADCAKFVICENQKVAQTLSCPKGLHFNRYKKVCDNKAEAGCQLPLPHPKLAIPPTATGGRPQGPKPAVDRITSGPQSGPSGTSCTDPGPCAGQKDGAMFIHPNNSNLYIVCQCECPIIMPCPPGLVFNPELNVCDWPKKTTQPTQPPTQTPTEPPTGTPTDSTTEATTGSPTATPTEPPTGTPTYPPTETTTESPTEPSTGTPTEPPTGTPTDSTAEPPTGSPTATPSDPPTGTPTQTEPPTGSSPSPTSPSPPVTGPSGTSCSDPGPCTGQKDGAMFIHPNNTNLYIVCQCECPIIMPCPPGLVFNPELNVCDWSSNPITPSPPTTSPPGPTTTSPPETGPSGTSCTDPGPCAGQKDGAMFIHPNNSNLYIVCQCECPIIMPCPPGLVFNPELNVCDWPKKTTQPTQPPTQTPTEPPTGTQTDSTTEAPTGSPTATPTEPPTGTSTYPPTETTTESPTEPTTGTPTEPPTGTPTDSTAEPPTGSPTATPSDPPTGTPTQTEPPTGSSPSPTSPSPPVTGPSGTSCSDPGPCTGQKDGAMFIHPNNTNLYIVCQCECPIIMPCPPGLVFNPELNVCDWPSNPITPSPPGPTTTLPPETGPSGTSCTDPGPCAGQKDGAMFIHPNNSNLYIVCQCECPIIMPCPPGLVFNPDLNVCDWPSNPITPSPPGPTTTSPPETGPSGTSCTDPGPCAGQKDGAMFIHPNNSNLYIVCQCECPIIMPCPPGLVFNPELNVCDWPKKTTQPTQPPTQTPTEPPTGTPTDSTTEAPNGSPTATPTEPPTGTPTYPPTETTTESSTEPPTGTPTEPPTGTPTDSTAEPPTGSPTATPSDPPTGTPTQTEPPTGSSPSPTSPSPPVTGPSGTSCSDPGPCTGQKDGAMFIHPNNSNLYIVCQCECPIIMPCPPGLVFNPELNVCDWSSNPITPSPPTPSPPGPTTTSPPETGPSGTSCTDPGSCAGQKDGAMFIHPNNSNLYIVCQCECPIIMPCPPGLVFNPELNVCDWPSNPIRPSPPTPSPPGPTTTSPPETGPSGTSCTDPGSCAGQKDGAMFIHPNNSNLYIVCQCECPIIMLCPPGLVFNPELNVCDWPKKTTQPTQPPTQTPTEPPTGTPTYPPTETTTESTTEPPTGTPTEPPTGTPTDSTTEPPTGSPTATPSEPPAGTPTQTEPPTESSPSPSSPSPPVAGPSGTSCSDPGPCAGQKDGAMFIHPNNSNLYIVCQCECPIIMPCPPGLVFNPELNVCDWPKKR